MFLRPSRSAAATALLLAGVSTAGRVAGRPVRSTLQRGILNGERQPATGAFILGCWAASGVVSNFAGYNAGLFMYRKD